MKRTEIKYVELDKGKGFKIVGIENAATLRKLREEFGVGVKENYQSTRPRYFSLNSGKLIVRLEGEETIRIKVGDVLPKDTFEKMIAAMKIAGKNLSKAKRTITKSIVI